MRRAGFVLVGGASSRMGRDKALLPYRGATLAGHVASTVREAAGSVTLIGPAERYKALGFPVVSDLVAGHGPLGGILTALAVSAADWNLIVACDMPLLSAAFLKSLLAEAAESGGDCLVPTSRGRLEPLCAVYHRAALPVIREAIESNRRKVTDALAGLHVVRLPVPEAVWFANLNTPEDWASHKESVFAAAPIPGEDHG